MRYMPGQTDKARKAIRLALLQEWDPIGIADVPEAQDEYDSYVQPVYELLVTHQPEHEILRYLWWLETEQMGLTGNRKVTERFAKRLMLLEDELEKEFLS
jgi:hypothetical protein